jgi:hydroxymethylglutaryl-CoA lyase
MTNLITIYEVGPRDGLQNEASIIRTPDKIALIDALSKTGLRKVEATSFVSPKWVPQMADAADVMAGITRNPSVDYAVLTPNMRGLEGALTANADEVAIFGSASDSFSQKNLNCSIAESIERFAPVAKGAQKANIKLRGYVSCITDCPYEGSIIPAAVLDVVTKLADQGCYEISLGDTIGKATPDAIKRLLDVLLTKFPATLFAGHFHDTSGNAIQNVTTALPFGLRTFDSAIGGLGGCPYAPGAKGNVSTIPLVNYLHENGWETGLDMGALAQAQNILNGFGLKGSS